MTPSEFLHRLRSLPPETPISAAHIAAILETLAPLLEKNSQIDFDSLPNSKLIDEDTLAEWLGESPSSLQKWRVKGGGPSFVKGPKSVRYSVGAIRDWIASRTVMSTSEASVKGLSKLEGRNFEQLGSLMWPYPRPIIVGNGKLVGLFRSLQEDLEVEVNSLQMVRMRELSALHPPRLPPGAGEDAELLIAVLSDFGELVKTNPQKAREKYGEWEERMTESERFGFFAHALAFDLQLAQEINEKLPQSLIAENFNTAAWLWTLFVEVGLDNSYINQLPWAFKYLAQVGVDINRTAIIEDLAGVEVFSGSIAHILADTTGEFYAIDSNHLFIQEYTSLLGTLFDLGLSADLPSDSHEMLTARAIGKTIKDNCASNGSPFSRTLESYELAQLLRHELS